MIPWIQANVLFWLGVALVVAGGLVALRTPLRRWNAHLTARPPAAADTEIKDVFLSYARVDKDVAEPLKTWLEELGISVFLDVDDLPLGTRFPERIQRQLDGCVVARSTRRGRPKEGPACRPGDVLHRSSTAAAYVIA